MIWRYKTVVYTEDQHKKLLKILMAHSDAAEKKAAENLRSKHQDWDDNVKNLTGKEREAILARDYYPQKNEILVNESGDELGEFEPVFLQAKDSSKDVIPVTFTKYLELLLNLHALDGWELDKVRHSKTGDNFFLDFPPSLFFGLLSHLPAF